jgi:hypothetical protein
MNGKKAQPQGWTVWGACPFYVLPLDEGGATRPREKEKKSHLFAFKSEK